MEFLNGENGEKVYNDWVLAQKENAYGLRVFSYAKDWAELMEARMVLGEKIVDIAKETSREADTDGITGFMYGVSVSILAECWKHGEGLRQWHNLDTQIGNEGEKANENGTVINPALLNISIKE